MEKNIPFATATKIIKYLCINLTEVPYTENCKIFLKEIKEDTKKWKDILHSWIRRINIVKMAILPNATYRLKAILIKIPMEFLKK